MLQNKRSSDVCLSFNLERKDEGDFQFTLLARYKVSIS